VARASSKSSGRTGNPRRKTAQPDSGTASETRQTADTAGITNDSVGFDPATSAQDSTPPQNLTAPETGMEPPVDSTDDTNTDHDTVQPVTDTPTQDREPADVVDAPPSPGPARDAAPAARRGGFVPLVLGGVLAAGIGYGVAYMGWLPTNTAPQAPTTATLTEAMAPLQDQISALVAAMPETAEPVDLSPVMEQIMALSTRIDAANDGITALSARITALENQPLGADASEADPTATATASVAAAEAETAAMEATLEAERAAQAARETELQVAAEAAAMEAEAARAALAEIEAEAAADAATQDAQVALGQLQAAMATGTPFADPLARISAVTDAPEALIVVAETGLPTRGALQDRFPALARAALPVALQETAGEGMGDRLGAFVMGQIGGRSVAPRDGDDPDAVLSRVEAAVRAGDLAMALTEIAALPDGARAVLAPWVADVEARAAAEAGLAALTAALADSGN